MRDAAQVISDLLRAQAATVKTYHPEVARTGAVLEQLIAGTSFFPGGSGLWRGLSHGGPLPAYFPDFPIMLVGHNFDSQRAYQRSLLRKGEASGQFWKFLLLMLEAAGVKPQECFFTNALMGLKPGIATGPMPRVPGYLEECAAFLAEQANIVQARCLIALGANSAPLVRQINRASITVKHPSSWIYCRGHLRAEGLQQEGAKISAFLCTLSSPSTSEATDRSGQPRP